MYLYLDIDEVDPECVKEILEDHKKFPPQHRPGDPEGVYSLFVVFFFFQCVLLFIWHLDVNCLD